MERDHYYTALIQTMPYFNSHAHVERDNGQFNSTVYKNNFNSHAHVERDLSQVKAVNLAFERERVAVAERQWPQVDFVV